MAADRLLETAKAQADAQVSERNAREKAALFQKRLNRGLEIHNATTGLLPITCTIRLTHNDELHYVSIYDLVKLRPDSCGAHSHAPA